MSGEVALKLVKPPTWSVQIFWLDRIIKSEQLETQLLRMPRLNPRLRSGLKELLDTAMPEALDHQNKCIALLYRSSTNSIRLERKSICDAWPCSANHQECQGMRIVESVGEARVDLYAVKLDQRSEVISNSNIQPADGPECLVVRAVNNTTVRGDRQAGPVLQVLACR